MYIKARNEVTVYKRQIRTVNIFTRRVSLNKDYPKILWGGCLNELHNSEKETKHRNLEKSGLTQSPTIEIKMALR